MNGKYFLGLLVITLFIVGPKANAISYNLIQSSGAIISSLNYDFDNTTNFTSYSYKDNSLINPNAFVKICGSINGESLKGKFVEIAYTNQNCSEVIPLSVLASRIQSVGNDNCSIVDIDLASYNALYPGRISLLILNSSKLYSTVNKIKTLNTTGNFTNNQTNQTTEQTTEEPSNVEYCGRMNASLNGSFKLDVSVDDVQGTVSFRLKEVRDENGKQIDFSNNYGHLVVSLENKDNQTIGTEIIKPLDTATFNYTFVGGEKVYVNGLLSLRIITFNPCGRLNESGYYLLNASAWNKNSSCIIIENMSKITLNFANKTIDGDGAGNGSLKNGSCAIIIKNSKNITINDLRTEQFNYGLCIYNSTSVNVEGTYDKANINGARVENSNDVKISKIKINNSNFEIYTINSTINLNKLESPSANFSLKAHDITIKTVRNPPKQPEGLMNISQWLTVKNSSDKSWSIITFHYTKPLPHNVLEATLDLYKYDYNTNGTNGTWYPVPSYTDKINKMIYSINITNFSVFVPLGEEVVAKPKNPPPTPPTTGHIQQKVVETMMNVPPQPRTPKIKLRLLNHTIRVEQGQSAYVKFNVTDLGETILNVIVKANISRPGWKSPPAVIKEIKRYQTVNGSLYLKVYDNEIPGTYFVPVIAKVSNMTLDTDLLKVIVTPRGMLARMKIIEAAPKVTFVENRWHEFPVLVKNNGDYNLTNITLHFDYAKDCIESTQGTYNLSIGEQETFKYRVKVKKAYQSCDAIMILKSNQGAIAFAPIVIEVVPQRFGGVKILPIIFAIFTALSIFVLIDKYKQMMAIKKRKKKIKEEFE